MIGQINSRFVFRLKTISRILAILVFAVGILAMMGWQFDISFLKKILPNLPVIAPNTAFLFVLIGFSLLLLSIKETSGMIKAALYSFSFLAIIVGLLTMLEYILNLNLRFDSIFFADKMPDKIVRMSPQSAFNFFAVGLSLFFLTNRNKRRIIWGQAIVLIAGLVSAISLFGFIYNISNLYTIAPYKGMAAHTAVAFVTVFVAILAMYPDVGFMRVFSRKGLSGIAARRLFITLILLIIVEIFVMLGRQAGIYNYTYESLIHLLLVSGVFMLLIFYVFRSLDQLAEAERDVERIKEIDRAKTEFVSIASHQLRTPLTSISWFTEMLMKSEIGELNDKQKEYLGEIYRGNQRMIDLVNDILNTSRIDTGILISDPITISLKETLESVLSEIVPLFEDKGIEIIKDYGENIPQINADPELAQVIFQNLLSNSLKYTPKGGSVTIGISDQGANVLIKISDSGYGIPKEQQSRIFTKLFRADNIRSKETDGTGLGLYIARAIVRQSGGKIWFDSVENTGTNFYVTFPIKKIINKHKAD
jgi:signal transduction histidine kinase